MRAVISNQTQAVRERPKMYLQDFSREDQYVLIRAVLRVFLDSRVFSATEITFRLRSDSLMEIDIIGQWTEEVLVIVNLAAAGDIAAVIFEQWKIALREAINPQIDSRVLLLQTLTDLGAVLYLAGTALIRINAKNTKLECRYQAGYFQSITQPPFMGEPPLTCRIELRPDSEIFQAPIFSYDRMQNIIQDSTKGVSERLIIEHQEAQQETRLRLGQRNSS